MSKQGKSTDASPLWWIPLGLMGIGGVGVWLKKNMPSGEMPATGQSKAVNVVASPVDSGWDFSQIINWGIGVPLAAAGVGLISWGALQLHYKRQAKKLATTGVARIIPHAKTRSNADEVTILVESLWYSQRSRKNKLKYGEPWYELLYHCYKSKKHPDGQIGLWIKYPKETKEETFQLIRDCYPNSEIVEYDWKDVPFPVSSQGHGGVLTWADPKEQGLPLKKHDGKEKISKIISHMRPGSFLSVAFHKAKKAKFNSVIEKTRAHVLKKYGKDEDLPKHISAKDSALDQRKNDTGMGFEVKISVWSDKPGKTVANLVSRLKQFFNDKNRIEFKPYRKPQLEKAPYPFANKMFWTGYELAPFFQLPQMKSKEASENGSIHIYDRFPHRFSGQALIDAKDMMTGLLVGTLIHPCSDRPIFVNEDQINNILVLGTTGGGKSSFLLNMVREDLLPRFFGKKPSKSFGGLTVIDPKAEMVWTILTYLRKWKNFDSAYDDSKIHYFDINSPKYCLGLNLLYRYPWQTADTVVKNATKVIGSAYEGESEWFKKYASLTIKALMKDKEEQHSILAIPEFLEEDSRLRERIKGYLRQSDDMDDLELLRDLEREEQNFGTHKTDPLVDRINKLRQNTLTKNIFGQKTNSIDPLRYLEEGHITLMNIEGLDELETKLIMGYITQLYWECCQIRKNKAQKHIFAMDEAHNVQLDILHTDILPKSRSKGLMPVFMTQFLDQFNIELRKSINSLVDNIFTFRCLGETAEELLEYTPAKFEKDDLQKLPNLTAAAITKSSQGERITFLMETDPPYVLNKEGEPTYFGSDKDRVDEERERAWREARLEIGYPLMARDCKTIEQVKKEFDEYRKKLWGGKFEQERSEVMKEQAATRASQKKNEKPVDDIEQKIKEAGL
jgi:hypothetical protein